MSGAGTETDATGTTLGTSGPVPTGGTSVSTSTATESTVTSASSAATDQETGATSSTGEATSGGEDFCGQPEPTLAFSERDTIALGGSVGFLYTTNLYGDTGTHVVAVNLIDPRVDLLQNNRLIGDLTVDDTINVTEEPKVAVGDLNGNGSDDIVVSSRDTVEAFFYDGDALLPAGPLALANSPVWAVAIADFGGSAFGDVALQNNGATPEVEFLLGSGTNIELPSTNFAAGRRSTVMIPALMDGDNVVDLVVARTDADRQVNPDAVTVMLNRTDGEAFDFEIASYSTDPTPWGLAVADFNNDATNDVVVASQGEGLADGSPDTIQLFTNDGAGDLTSQPAIEVGDSLGQVAVGDLDCDGLLDVAVTSADGVFVLLGDGEGLGDPVMILDVAALPLGLVVGHFTSDDRLDVLVGIADTGDVIFYAVD